jgi:hypothetical protein
VTPTPQLLRMSSKVGPLSGGGAGTARTDRQVRTLIKSRRSASSFLLARGKKLFLL